MCASVLLNLLNSLRKSKPHMLSPFLNSFINSIKHVHSCKILYVYMEIPKMMLWQKVKA